MMGSPPTIVVRTEEIETNSPEDSGLPPSPNPKAATGPTTDSIRGQSPERPNIQQVDRTSAFQLPPKPATWITNR